MPVADTVTNEAAPKGETGAQLAHTGAPSSASALAAAGGLLALGGGAMLYTRRRQNS